MANLSQLILGETGCVSYIVYCNDKKEGAIVDAFEGYESNIEKELERIGAIPKGNSNYDVQESLSLNQL